jgi:hypothetical protein
MDPAKRRKILEEWDLVFTEEQETWKILKDEPMDTLSYY